jgi:hypothetical protein
MFPVDPDIYPGRILTFIPVPMGGFLTSLVLRQHPDNIWSKKWI